LFALCGARSVQAPLLGVLSGLGTRLGGAFRTLSLLVEPQPFTLCLGASALLGFGARAHRVGPLSSVPYFVLAQGRERKQS
jgi:hypothetical protein